MAKGKFKNWWNNKLVPWWQDKIADNFHSETRDNSEGMGRFLNGVDNFWNRITGSGLTNAEREANKYSAAQAEEQYNREVEFYEKYQSPKAMMQQGVNPFGINGSTGGHTASGGSPSSVSPQGAEGLGGMMSLVQSIFGMVQQKRSVDSEIALNKSAEDRNYSEANERNINAETLKDMNLATIMEKLSNVELNNSNVKLITSKILNTDADTQLKFSYIAKVAAEILNIEADTNVKADQLNVMLAEIANLNADTDLKRKMFDKLISDVLVNDKQLEVFTAQIGLMGTQAGLNRAEAVKVQAEWQKILQDYGHDEVMNSFTELLARKSVNVEGGYDPENYKDQPVMRRLINVLNALERLLDFKASSSHIVAE